MTTEIKHYDIKEKLVANGISEEDHVKLQSLYNEKMHELYLYLADYGEFKDLSEGLILYTEAQHLTKGEILVR